jgi:stress response protein YsnF
MLREWSEKVRPLYRSVDLGHEEAWQFTSRDPLAMTDERYEHMSKLRQEGLDEARRTRVNYLLVRIA